MSLERAATPADGPRGSRAGGVTVPDLGAHPTVDTLARRAIAQSIVQLLENEPLVRIGGDEEGVHKFRVATRRLRSDLRTFADFLGREDAERLRDELRWLGAEVGRVRDIDVLADNLQRAIGELPANDIESAGPLLERLARQARRARQAMLAALRSDRYQRLLAGLIRIAGPAQSNPQGGGRRHKPAASILANLVRNRWRRLARSVDGLGENPPDSALHEVRIKAKQCRYAAEAVTPVLGTAAARFAGAVSRLQTVLGEHHDTVVAEAWLRAAAAATPTTCLVAGELIAHQRAQRARLRAEWPSVWKAASAKRLRAWF